MQHYSDVQADRVTALVDLVGWPTELALKTATGNADPLEDIHMIDRENVVWVMKDGTVYKNALVDGR